jgi:hypothetical protein
MADDRHYVGGDNYILDDLSGFKIRASRARVIPGGQTGGLAVAPERWEPQQSQDFVIGVRDDQTVSLSRPRQTNQFVIVGTYVTAPSPAQSQTITVANSVGFSVGSPVLIMLDSGVNFQTHISGIAGLNWTLADPLPASVGTLYGDPIENAILLLTVGTGIGLFVLDTSEGILNENVLSPP